MTASRPVVTGVLLLIVSEAVFFGMLIITYLYFFADPAVASAARAHLDPFRTGIFSLFLLSSSVTMWRAERVRRAGQEPSADGVGAAARAQLGKTDRTRLWLAATLALGMVFLLGQAIEYAGLFGAGIGFGTNLFGSTFFALTGFHGLHVLIGLIAIAIVLGIDPTNVPGHGTAQQSISLYWHFVDGVWVVIFAIVYVLTLGDML